MVAQRPAITRTVLSLAALCLAVTTFSPQGPASSSPLFSFRAGAAVESLRPPVPVYSGGFGASPPITRVHDPLQVRAMYVSDLEEERTHAVAFAVVDSQAYFAAYQEGAHYGVTDVREEAAKRITRLGIAKMDAGDIIVQGSHSHSAPTLEGIWGPVPPRYLKLVHDRTVAALVEAARAAQPANLEWSSVDAPYLDNIDTQQTDSYPGWTQDGQVSVLRALQAGSGATIATFVNVPAHPDIVCGACLKLLSADYFGVARRLLDRELGGITIVGPATLGREESPLQTAGLVQSEFYGRTVANLVTGALTHATRVDDTSVRGTESLLRVPTANPALTVLNESWRLPPDQRMQMMDATGIYPINRSLDPPYATGNVVGTYLTALRIGSLLYLSQPGESFPEIRNTIRQDVHGADLVVALGKGQDDLGYYYPTWVEPFAWGYPSDHGIYNVAPQMGDQIIQEDVSLAGSLGFDTGSAFSTPMKTSWDQAAKPGLQALSSPATGDAGTDGTFTVTLEAIYEPAMTSGAPLDGKVHWDFGDGAKTTSSFVSFGQGGHDKPAFVEHAFRPGAYTVRLTGKDTNGNAVNWKVAVRVFPQLRPQIVVREGSWDLYSYKVTAGGGEGPILAARWHFADGTSASGASVLWRGRPIPATATVTDGTGTVATARWSP